MITGEMMESIDWRDYSGDNLTNSGLDDPELKILHGLFCEAFTGGKGIGYDRFLKRVVSSKILVGFADQAITTMSAYNHYSYPTESYMMVNAIAVNECYRRQGLGSVALRRIIDEAARLECDKVRLHARKNVLPFYQEHGFERNNNLETNLAYVPMHLDLSKVKTLEHVQ